MLSFMHMYVYYYNPEQWPILSRIFSRINSRVQHAQIICWKLSHSNPTSNNRWAWRPDCYHLVILTKCSVQLYTCKGSLNNINLHASCSHSFSYGCWKFVSCSVVQVSLLQHIQHGLPLMGGGGLSAPAVCLANKWYLRHDVLWWYLHTYTYITYM